MATIQKKTDFATWEPKDWSVDPGPIYAKEPYIKGDPYKDLYLQQVMRRVRTEKVKAHLDRQCDYGRAPIAVHLFWEGLKDWHSQLNGDKPEKIYVAPEVYYGLAELPEHELADFGFHLTSLFLGVRFQEVDVYINGDLEPGWSAVVHPKRGLLK